MRMKRSKLMILGAWSVLAVASLAAATTRGSAHAAAALPDGAETYTANCAKCHGDDGKAKTPKGKRVEATDLTSDWNADEERGIKIITKGKGDMPAFKDKLSADEIKDVFHYVLKFRADKK